MLKEYLMYKSKFLKKSLLNFKININFESKKKFDNMKQFKPQKNLIFFTFINSNSIGNLSIKITSDNAVELKSIFTTNNFKNNSLILT